MMVRAMAAKMIARSVRARAPMIATMDGLGCGLKVSPLSIFVRDRTNNLR